MHYPLVLQDAANYPSKFAFESFPQITAKEFKLHWKCLYRILKLNWDQQTEGLRLSAYFSRKIEKWTNAIREEGSCLGEAIEFLLKILEDPTLSNARTVKGMSSRRIAAFHLIQKLIIKMKQPGQKLDALTMMAVVKLINSYNKQYHCYQLPAVLFRSDTISAQLNTLRSTLVKLKAYSSNLALILVGTGNPGHAITLQFNPTYRVYDSISGCHFLMEEEMLAFISEMIQKGLEENKNHQMTLYTCLVCKAPFPQHS